MKGKGKDMGDGHLLFRVNYSKAGVCGNGDLVRNVEGKDATLTFPWPYLVPARAETGEEPIVDVEAAIAATRHLRVGVVHKQAVVLDPRTGLLPQRCEAAHLYRQCK